MLGLPKHLKGLVGFLKYAFRIIAFKRFNVILSCHI